ncbi:MAG: type polyketide synthase [Chitinophagaceae bacterium]|nr:type polyketide synthase [Chitinophagaceae bacterium]
MTRIINIATALPQHCHQQSDILQFMQRAYHLDETDKRKLVFLYKHSGIERRYSVLDDFSKQDGWSFIPSEKNDAFPSMEKRMDLYNAYAPSLSLSAIENCIDGIIDAKEITHLITVSCTGMSAPGLDLLLAEKLGLPPNIFRTSINFMGCYAAIHGLKFAKLICDSTPNANVLIVATELCTLHFQKEYNIDNAASSLLFGDGSAAVLVSNKIKSQRSVELHSFYSQVSYEGKADMAWELSSQGFKMKLSSYVPDLIEKDIIQLIEKAAVDAGIKSESINYWCLHPGGRKILDNIQSQLELPDEALSFSRKVLKEYGNMSSPSVLFVLKEMLQQIQKDDVVFGAAFGPGLTMETFIAKG